MAWRGDSAGHREAALKRGKGGKKGVKSKKGGKSVIKINKYTGRKYRVSPKGYISGTNWRD